MVFIAGVRISPIKMSKLSIDRFNVPIEGSYRYLCGIIYICVPSKYMQGIDPHSNRGSVREDNTNMQKLPPSVKISFLRKSNSNEELPKVAIPDFIKRSSLLKSKCQLCE